MIHNHIYHVKNFKEHKKNLIDLIYKIPQNPIDISGDKIYHQDYNLPKKMKREYKDYFKNNILNEFASSVCNFFGSKAIEITNLWFQVYKKGDYHDVHNHPNTNLTNVFYLNLPNTEIKTQIFLPKNEKFTTDVSEGDILTFPGYYGHKSPVNIFNEEKIIISFNMNTVYGQNREYL